MSGISLLSATPMISLSCLLDGHSILNFYRFDYQFICHRIEVSSIKLMAHNRRAPLYKFIGTGHQVIPDDDAVARGLQW